MHRAMVKRCARSNDALMQVPNHSLLSPPLPLALPLYSPRAIANFQALSLARLKYGANKPPRGSSRSE